MAMLHWPYQQLSSLNRTDDYTEVRIYECQKDHPLEHHTEVDRMRKSYSEYQVDRFEKKWALIRV